MTEGQGCAVSIGGGLLFAVAWGLLISQAPAIAPGATGLPDACWAIMAGFGIAALGAFGRQGPRKG